MRLEVGKVVDIHPEGNTVDVRLAEDNRRLVGVPVLGTSLSGNSGLVDLPVPDLTTARSEPEKWESLNTDKRDMLAIIGWVSESAVCLGFVCPPLCELNFPKAIGEERRIDRHASDFYQTITRDGDVEWAHPSGTFVRIAEDLNHEDLTGLDYDKLWKIRRNLRRRPGIRVRIANEDGVQVTLTLAPDGRATLDAAGDVSVTSGGAVTIAASSVNITADEINLDGMVKINGIVQQGT